MKKIYLLLHFYFVITFAINSQNVGINTTGATPAATNMLEVLQTSTSANSVGIYSAHSGAISGTGYGIRIYKTGASTTNVAADFNASGATSNTAAAFTVSGAHTTNTAATFSATGATSNYAIIVPASSGNVGIGTTTPSQLVHVVSTNTSADTKAMYIQHSGAASGNGYCIYTEKTGASTGSNYGGYFYGAGATTGNGGVVATGSGGNTSWGISASATGGTSSSTGITASATGATTNYGARFQASGGTANYAIVVPSGQGNVGIGTETPSSKAILEMSSTSAGILIPRMTNAQRTSLAPGASSNQGLLIYQTDVGTTAPTGIGFYYWDGSAWTGIGSSTSGTSSSSFSYSSNTQVQDEFYGSYKISNFGGACYDSYSPFSLGWSHYASAAIGCGSHANWANDGTSTADHPGVTKIMIGNNSASTIKSFYLSGTPIDARTPNFICSWIINNTSSSLSAGSGAANEYYLKVGLMDATCFTTASTANPTNGIFFETTKNDGFWYATGVRSAATAGTTKTSTTVVPALNTWTRLDLRSDATGAIWNFYVNGTLRATIDPAVSSGKIPAAGTLLTPGIKIALGSSGSHTIYPELSIDYYYMSSTVTR